MLERLFGRTREDLTRRADEKYARENFMICILPQIFFRKIKRRMLWLEGHKLRRRDVRSMLVRKL